VPKAKETPEDGAQQAALTEALEAAYEAAWAVAARSPDVLLLLTAAMAVAQGQLEGLDDLRKSARRFLKTKPGPLLQPTQPEAIRAFIKGVEERRAAPETLLLDLLAQLGAPGGYRQTYSALQRFRTLVAQRTKTSEFLDAEKTAIVALEAMGLSRKLAANAVASATYYPPKQER